MCNNNNNRTLSLIQSESSIILCVMDESSAKYAECHNFTFWFEFYRSKSIITYCIRWNSVLFLSMLGLNTWITKLWPFPFY